MIKNAAVSINLLDWAKQLLGDMLFTWVKYPAILGSDVAGVVEEVGEDVTAFKKGDRVVGAALALDPAYNKASEGGFQEYVVLHTHMASKIPDHISFAEASVIPMGISTAACGLFQKDFLGLDLPTSSQKDTAKTKGILIIWGGSTSVGCNAIQLATAAGYDVIATASPKNFEYLKLLGASELYDYSSKSVVPDIIGAIKRRKQNTVGAMSIGKVSLEACMEILAKTDGTKFVAQVSMEGIRSPPTNMMILLSNMPYMLYFNTRIWLKGLASGVSKKFVFGGTLAQNEVGPAIYNDFLPEALVQGTFVPAPKPEVVGNGLESIQAACDTLRAGVSNKKIVVTF